VKGLRDITFRRAIRGDAQSLGNVVRRSLRRLRKSRLYSSSRRIKNQFIRYPIENRFPEHVNFFFPFSSETVDNLPEFKGALESLKYLYIHIPKCGGTSVLETLRRQGFLVIYSWSQLVERLKTGAPIDRLSLDHLDTSVLIETGLILKDTLENRVITFAHDRDPFRKVVSAWRHHKRTGRISLDTPFERYLRTVSARYWPTTQYNEIGFSHANPSRYWLTPASWSGPKYVFDLEAQEKFNKFFEHHFFSRANVPHLNKGKLEEGAGAPNYASFLEYAEWFRPGIQ